MFCTNCGNRLRDTDRFCTNCGREVVKTAAKEENRYTILAERDSVCMGDDVLAPNPRDLEYGPDDRLSDFMAVIDQYVQHMGNVVWEIFCKDREIAYLIYDENGQYLGYELAIPDIRVAQLPEKRIYCRRHIKDKLVERFSQTDRNGKGIFFQRRK